MSNDQNQIKDEAYLKIWEVDQEHVRMRWTVITFFMSVSFAIFGFSFQEKLISSESLALRIAALLVYWFAVLLLYHFYRFNRFLRNYMLMMEKEHQTSLDIQGKANDAHLAQKPSTTALVLGLGIIYTGGVLLLRLLSL